MKKKDIMLVAIIAIVSAVLSIILSNTFISSKDKHRSESVEVVAPIATEFTRPPSAYYNDDSLNPTQTIEIGPDKNTNAFE